MKASRVGFMFVYARIDEILFFNLFPLQKAEERKTHNLFYDYDVL